MMLWVTTLSIALTISSGSQGDVILNVDGAGWVVSARQVTPTGKVSAARKTMSDPLKEE